MKLNVSRDKIDTNIQSARQFTVTQNSAKLFSLLSTVLYTNKELAVIRENCDNAIDIHTKTGQKDRPIEIVMPTNLEPVYRIRDFGTGLSEQDVYRLLTTYGESDKGGSNQEIGGFGIGFKSTAAVTDTWTVTSFYAGERSEYLIFVNEDGIPNITKIRSEATTEVGIEVAIPINPNRINVWKSATEAAFVHYNVKPIIRNVKIEIPTVKYFYECDSYKVAAVDPDYSTEVNLITSNRAYKLKKDVITTEFKGEAFLAALIMPIYINAGIGEVDLSLSREDVQYTKRTLSFLKTKLTEVYNDYITRIESILDQAKTGIEFRTLIHTVRKDILNIHHSSYKLDEWLLKIVNAKYARFNVKDLRHDIEKFRFELPDGKKAGYKAYRGKSFKEVKPKFNCWKSYIVECSEVDWKSKEWTIRFSIKHLDKIKIVKNDVRGVSGRIREWYTQGDVVLLVDSVAEIPDELKHKIILGSSLPKVKVERTSSGVRATKADYNTEVFVKGPNVAWRREDVSKLSGKVVFVNLLDARCGKIEPVVDKGARSAEINTEYLIQAFTNLDYTVVGVKPQHGKPKFPFIKDEAEKLIAPITTKKFQTQNQQERFYHDLMNEMSYYAFFRRNIKTSKDSYWNTIADLCGEAKKFAFSAENNNNLYYLKQIYSILKGVEFKEPPRLIEDVKKNLTEKYPMLQYVNTDTYSFDADKINAIKEYIEQNS